MMCSSLRDARRVSHLILATVGRRSEPFIAELAEEENRERQQCSGERQCWIAAVTEATIRSHSSVTLAAFLTIRQAASAAFRTVRKAVADRTVRAWALVPFTAKLRPRGGRSLEV